MRIALVLGLAALGLHAHVGSPDVYFDGQAGPYRLVVTIRPPAVIPGVAEIEIRGPGADRLYITPTPLTGPGAKFAPAPDLMRRPADDAAFFTGALWMMSSGSWQVKIRAEGAQGQGGLNVPVPNAAKRTLAMSQGLGIAFFGLMMLLGGGLIAIAGAAARESGLEQGVAPGEREIRRGRWAMAGAGALVLLALWGGRAWWGSEAREYDDYIYKPLGLKATLDQGLLRMHFEHKGWMQSEQFDDLVPDHGHLMHLFVVRLPDLDRVWHLHPKMTGNGVFEHQLPAMPRGRYQLFGDIVHRSGFPETLVSEIDLPELPGAPLSGDDTASGGAPPSIVFDNASERFVAKRLTPMRFRFASNEEIELYLGMRGHVVVLKKDRSVFVHLHPTGTVPMASLQLAAGGEHAGHYTEAKLPAAVAFPYGFPTSGDYRVFVQLKRKGQVETAPFDVVVK